jgi:hypothetical protein
VMMGSPLGGLRRTLAFSPATLGTENAELDRELEGLGVVLDCFLATVSFISFVFLISAKKVCT